MSNTRLPMWLCCPGPSLVLGLLACSKNGAVRDRFAKNRRFRVPLALTARLAQRSLKTPRVPKRPLSTKSCRSARCVTAVPSKDHIPLCRHPREGGNPYWLAAQDWTGPVLMDSRLRGNDGEDANIPRPPPIFPQPPFPENSTAPDQPLPFNNPARPASSRSDARASKSTTAPTASASPGTRPGSPNSPRRRSRSRHKNAA